ncbi:MAG TPA: hypothetical protein VHN99_09840 [Deinococcales bacterium]|nr:hypothetical protein [Deinococcales bacterium]
MTPRTLAPLLGLALCSCAPSAFSLPDVLHTLNLGPAPARTNVELGVPYGPGEYRACLSDRQRFSDLPEQAAIAQAAVDAGTAAPKPGDAAYVILLTGDGGAFIAGDALTLQVTADGTAPVQFAAGRPQDVGGQVLAHPEAPDPNSGSLRLDLNGGSSVPVWVTGPSGACFTLHETRER